MKPQVSTIFVTLVAFAFGYAAGPDKAPLASVTVRDQAVFVTLAPEARMLVISGSSEPRLAQPGEIFTLEEGSTLRISERHSSYHITPQLTPKVGVRVDATLDARSVRGEVTKKHYFIRAE